MANGEQGFNRDLIWAVGAAKQMSPEHRESKKKLQESLEMSNLYGNGRRLRILLRRMLEGAQMVASCAAC